MNISRIISDSFKYPFRNIKKLPILFILFVLMAIVPIGMIYDNNYAVIIGVISFLAFILIVPGYLVSIIKKGSIGSSMFPSFNLMDNIYNSIRVLLLRIVYMLVPATVFFISLATLGSASIGFIYELDILAFLATSSLAVILIIITYAVFEFLLFFAKARLAYLNSLTEALKIHKVIIDIKTIGIFNIIKWLIFMAVLISAISFITSFVMSIPYVGFLIYVAIVIPLMESIGNYSLGLLYSNIARNNDKFNKIAG